MRKNKLEHGDIRVINIDRNTIFEWLYESMIENAERFFDIDDVTTVSMRCEWDSDTDEFTCVVAPISVDAPPSEFQDFDFPKIRARTGLTTDSLFSKTRYKTICVSDDTVNTKT